MEIRLLQKILLQKSYYMVLKKQIWLMFLQL